MPHQKIHQHRIGLVAGAILIIVTLLAGVTVFVVMQRHAEALLSKSLQLSLQSRVQLTEAEIGAGFDSTVLISTRPLMTEQLQLLNARADNTDALNKLNAVARSFLQKGVTAIAFYGEDGQELARTGVFAQQPELAVPLNFPGHVQLMWDGQLLLRAVVEIKKEGRVVGKVMTESSLPATIGAIKDARLLGETGDQLLCVPAGLNMQCFPTTLRPRVFTTSQKSPDGVPLPIIHAFKGNTGFVIATDYRDQQVAAAYAPVGDLGLWMSLEIDTAELFAPVWQQLRFLIPLLLGVFIIALLLLRWLLTPLVVRLIRSEAEAAQRTTALTEEIAERKHAEEHLRTIIDTNPECIKLVGADGRLIEMNAAGLAMIEADSLDQVIHASMPDLLLPEHREAFQALTESVLQGNKGMLVFEIQGLKGTRRWLETHAVPMTMRTGETVLLGITHDITARKRAAAELLRLKHVLDNTLDMIFMFEPESLRFVYVNQGAILSMGYSLEELLGMTPLQIKPLMPEAEFRQLIAPLLSGERSSLRFDSLHRRKDGTDFSVSVFLQLVKQSDGSGLFVAIVHDITEKKESEERIWQQANFDTLTGLPNRRMFHDRLEQEIKKSHRSGVPMLLLLLDLDHFKEVNDTLGHAQGDVLLVEAARRIAECVRETDTVARLGGDEFTVILSEMGEVTSVERIAQKIIERLAAPFQLLQETVFVSASVGITLYPDDARDIESLMKNADQAMYLAKSSGRNRFRHFTAALQEAAQTRMHLINDLRNALARKQLAVYYQPIVEIASGKIDKAEALLRWQHPELGMVSPMQFIPLAEESGLMHEIGDWVFHEATRELKRWRELFVPEFQVSVNVSPVQFRQSGAEDESSWLSHLRAMDLPGQGLVIEITEGLLLNAEINITEKLLSFRAAGVQVALDDFGAGYSSLSYLKKFAIDYLKIDQSFVRNLADDADDRALCEAIIVMAHTLGLKVIAEGVETEQQRDLLAAYGCDYAQGWLYSKAVPPEQFEALVWGQVK